MDTVQAVYSVQVVDTVQIVNSNMQSAGIGIFQNLNVLFSFLLTLFAGGMFWNARAQLKVAKEMRGNAQAHLKNATAMKSLEETNLKIAMMPNVIDLLNATDTLLKDMSDKKQKNKYKIIDDYFKKVEYVWLFLKKDSELLGRINNLMEAVTDLNQIRVKQEEEPNNPKLSRDWTEKSLKIQDIYKDIRVKCKEIFGFAIDLIPPQK